MCGIDDAGDLVIHQPLPQTLAATEAADPNRTLRQQWVANTTGERGDDIESSLAGSDMGDFPGFPGAAQNQSFQGCPLK